MSNNNLFVRKNQNLANSLHMSERAKIIGQNVARFRERAKMSQAALAKLIGVRSANTIGAIELGLTLKSKYLMDIANALGVAVSQLDPEVKEQENTILPGNQLVGEVDLDVYGTVEGGNGALVMSNEAVDRVRRPAPLANVRDGYGVIVAGESMVPLFRPGDVALIHPHLPPRADDVCLFVSEAHGEFKATLKEYRGQTKDAWKVKRYSPKAEEFMLKKKDWPRCEVVVGRYVRR